MLSREWNQELRSLRSLIGSHHDIYTLATELCAAARKLGERSQDALVALRDRSAELEALLSPHLAHEEAILAPEHLAEMIAEQELERAQLAIPRSQGSGALRSATFLVHSLEPAEQRELLGQTPWVFRKVCWDGCQSRRFGATDR